MKKWIIVLVIVGLLGYAVYDFVGNKDEEAEEAGEDADVGIEKGDTAPDFDLETVEGDMVKLSDLRGEKVMVNFWGSWCPPCRAEMPDIQKFHESEEDGVIVSVNLTETENSSRNVDEFIDEYGLTFDVLLDKDTSVGTVYQAQTLPKSFLINSEGDIHTVVTGPLNYDQMVESFDGMD